MRLRLALTDEGTGYGWLAYFLSMSYVVSSVSVVLFKFRKMNLFRLMISLMVSLSYAYLSTGRTFILLFFTLHLLPLVLMKQIKLKGLLVGTGALVTGIIFIAMMTAKGISSEKGLSDNISGFTENLRGYTIAPLLACSGLVEKSPLPTLGDNTFRTFTAILHTAGFAEAPPVLIRDYAHVPDATNVYTVYEVYFKDFGYFGFGFVALFSIFHFYLYRQMKTYGGMYLFLYSVACYPLAMQFFQDQYFSLFSTWVQFFIFYWVIFSTKGIHFNLNNHEIKS
jgi:oligosaccharide repeat unit polymerase